MRDRGWLGVEAEEDEGAIVRSGWSVLLGFGHATEACVCERLGSVDDGAFPDEFDDLIGGEVVGDAIGADENGVSGCESDGWSDLDAHAG